MTSCANCLGHWKSFQNTFAANIYKYTSALQVLNDEYQDKDTKIYQMVTETFLKIRRLRL